MANQDWIRALLMLACSGYLLRQIYIKTEMLLEKEIGFTEKAADSENMKFPSITFCPATIAEEISEEYNEFDFTADYKNLSRIEDMLISVRQLISINK